MKSIPFSFITTVIFILLPFLSFSQRLDTLESKPGVSFRGLSVINNRFLWVSGSKGTVGRSTNSGKTFQWLPVKGYEKRDFRDIEAFDAVTAVIMAVDSPGIILRTHDGGATWQEVYRDDRPGIFLDAMHFRNKKVGIAIGDPLNGKTVLIEGFDGGKTWTPIPADFLPLPDSGEACFASSGTNIQKLKRNGYAFVTGGARARFFYHLDYHDKWVDLPLVQHTGSTGANSLAIKSGNKIRNIVVVGGDFTRDTVRTGNAAISSDFGKTWSVPEEPPFGYRSSVTYIKGNKMIACGTSGVDISEDGGHHWRNISKTGYHVCQVAKDGHAVYLAGGNGRLARLVW
jgi:photosystem II stability/assembly factor-like uncharacterized protein